ncbi:circularly permuted type 2 ATP-grasp protein [Solirubrobacter sp. CPCC 204708]|uniref:Circularly permuted type 2 ATP-grasp protein n=1 Tax=Solirubrobacter deserti TaxID=2282478 RepID=A0ABT4RJ80_9ACTN|nr:circularly permuted type 2 ATP-grasp protein [Solirubrobacter deserti]MBE2317662.1 circularly permuted type 2 ATP-grasp protein [Solirubrobacter deserti]MDA0138612.1 circularly permuted type 2 ATP-grasp protein [Solirubrobacter deserti]
MTALATAAYDEAFAPDGSPRAAYAPALDAFAEHGPCLHDTSIAIGGGAQARPLPVDGLPRILTAAEWEPLAAGLEQRARLLEALLLAGPGAHPVTATSHYRERLLEGVELPGPPLAVVGFDVARGPDGAFVLLEANVLTPGHVALPAAREVARLWEHVAHAPRDTAAPLRDALKAALGEDAAILPNDPPSWETAWLARFLGLPLLEPHDPLPRTVWYRTAEDRVFDDAGHRTPLGDRLLEPLLAGEVRVLNRPGCGVVEDKRLLADAEPLIRDLLGETPRLATAETFLGPDALELDPRELVFKPSHGAGGRGVVVGPAASSEAIATVTAELRRAPHRWVAQRYLPLSLHPTGPALELRPVDLRAFAVRTPAGWVVPPGGVSRYPTDPRAAIVNTSAGGGIKAVWVT